MTADRIADIRARVEVASPGPWAVEDSQEDLNRWVVGVECGSLLQANLGYLGNSNQDDAAFIAHARQDVPWLLAEVERLQSELAKYVGQEPTLTEEALHEHEEQVRAKVAEEIWRAPMPRFAAGEDIGVVMRTMRNVHERLARVGPASDYWVRPGTEAPR